MTIRSKEVFLQGLWDWAVLDGCFGNTRIRPTDVDGLIERHRGEAALQIVGIQHARAREI